MKRLSTNEVFNIKSIFSSILDQERTDLIELNKGVVSLLKNSDGLTRCYSCNERFHNQEHLGQWLDSHRSNKRFRCFNCFDMERAIREVNNRQAEFLGQMWEDFYPEKGNQFKELKVEENNLENSRPSCKYYSDEEYYRLYDLHYEEWWSNPNKRDKLDELREERETFKQRDCLDQKTKNIFIKHKHEVFVAQRHLSNLKKQIQ